jgi:hypothetical protein
VPVCGKLKRQNRESVQGVPKFLFRMLNRDVNQHVVQIENWCNN